LEELEAGLDLAGPEFAQNHNHSQNHHHNQTHGDERLMSAHSLGYHYPNRHSRRNPNEYSPERDRTHSLEDKHEIRCQLPTGFSPKRTSGQFIHDYDIYLMHLRAGYYSSKGRRSNSKGSSKSRGRSGVGRSADNEDLEDIYASHRTQEDEHYKKNLSQKFKAVASMNSSSRPLGSIDSNVNTITNTNESIVRIRGSAHRKEQAGKLSRTAPTKSQAKLQAISKAGARNRKVSPEQESMDSVKRRYLETRANTKTRNTDRNSRGNSREISKEKEREQRMLASYRKEVIEEDSHDGDLKRGLERYIIDYSSRMDRIVNKKVSYALNFDWKRNAYKIRKTFYHLLLKKSREFTEALLGKMEASYENLTILREGKAVGPGGFNDFKRKIREFTKELAGIWEMEGCEQTLRAEEEGLNRMLIGTEEVDRLLLADLEDNCDKEILRLAGSDQETMMFLKDELQLNVDKIFKSLNNTIGRELSKSESLVTKLLSENVKDIFNNLDKNLQKISVEQMEKLVTEMNSASTKSIFTEQSLKSPQSVNFPLSVGLKNEVKNINIPETGTTLYPDDANRMLSANSKSEKDLRGVDSLGSGDSGSSRGRRIFDKTRGKLNYESVEGIAYAGRPNLVIERVGEVELRHKRGIVQQQENNKNLSIVRQQGVEGQKKVDIRSSPQKGRLRHEQEEEESEVERVLLNAAKPIPQEINYRDEYEQQKLDKVDDGSRKVVYSNVKAVGENKPQRESVGKITNQEKKTGIVTPKDVTFADVEEKNAQQKKEKEDDARRRRNLRGSLEITDETTTPTATTVKPKVPEPQQSKVEDRSRVSQSQPQPRSQSQSQERVNEKLSPRLMLEGSNPPSLRSARAEYKERRLSQEELKVESKEESSEGQGSKESVNEEGTVGTQGKRKTGSKARDEMKSILTKIDSLWGKFDEALARPKESFDRNKRALNESLNKSNSLRQQDLEESSAPEGRKHQTGQKDRSFQKSQEEDLKRRETLMKELAELKKESSALLEAKNKNKEQVHAQAQEKNIVKISSSEDRFGERDQSDGSRQDLKDIRSQYKRTKRQDSVGREEEEKLDKNQKTIDENKLKTGHYLASPRTQQEERIKKDDSPIKTSPKEKFSPLKGYLDSIKFERENLRRFQSARSQQEEDVGARVSTNPENTSSSARQYLDRNKNRSFGDDVHIPEREFKREVKIGGGGTPEKTRPSPKKFPRGDIVEYEEERKSNIRAVPQETADLPKRSNRDLAGIGVERSGKSPEKRQEYENQRTRGSLGYKEEYKSANENNTPEKRNPLARKTHSPRDQYGDDRSVNKRSPARDQPDEDTKKHLRNEGQTLAETRAETRVATEKHSLATSSQSTPPKDKGSKKEGDSDRKASSPKSQFSKERSQSREEHTHYGSPRKKSPLLRPPNSPTTPDNQQARFDAHRQPGFSSNRREQEERIPISHNETQNFQRGQRLESATSDLEPAFSRAEREKRRSNEARIASEEEEEQRSQRTTGRTLSHLPSQEAAHVRSDVRHQSSPLTSNKKPEEDAVPDEETMAQRRVEREARLQRIFAAQGLKRASTNETVQPDEADARNKNSQLSQQDTPEKNKQTEENLNKNEKDEGSNKLSPKKPETRGENELNVKKLVPVAVEETKGGEDQLSLGQKRREELLKRDEQEIEHKQPYTMQTVTEVSTPREFSPMRKNRGPQEPQQGDRSSFERRAMSRQTLSSNPDSRIYNESHESSMKERSSVESDNSPSQRMTRSPKTRQAENKLEQRPNRPSGSQSPFQRPNTAGEPRWSPINNESGTSEKRNLSDQKDNKNDENAVVSEKKEEGRPSSLVTLGSSQVGVGGVSIVPKFDFSESASENEASQQPQAKIPEQTQLQKKLLEAGNVENKDVVASNKRPVSEETKSSENLDITNASTKLESQTQADLTQRTHRITEPASSYRSPARTQRELQAGQSIEYDNGVETGSARNENIPEDHRMESQRAERKEEKPKNSSENRDREHQEVVTLPSESLNETQSERVHKRSANIKKQETNQESSTTEIDEAEKQEQEKEKDLSTTKQDQERDAPKQDILIHPDQVEKSPVRENEPQTNLVQKRSESTATQSESIANPNQVETKGQEDHSRHIQKSPAKETQTDSIQKQDEATETQQFDSVSVQKPSQNIEPQEESNVAETKDQEKDVSTQGDLAHRVQKSPARENETQTDLVQKRSQATETQSESMASVQDSHPLSQSPKIAETKNQEGDLVHSPVRENEAQTQVTGAKSDSISVEKPDQHIESQGESKIVESKDQEKEKDASTQNDEVNSSHTQRSPAKETQTDLIQKQNQATETQPESASAQKPDQHLESQGESKDQTQDIKQTETSQETQIQKADDLAQRSDEQKEIYQEEEQKTPVLSTVTEKSSRTSVEPQSEKDLSEKGSVRTQKGSSTVPPISHVGGIGLIERQAISSSNSLGAIDTPKFFDQRLDIAAEEGSPSQDLSSQNPRNLKNQIAEEEKRIQGHEISEDNKDRISLGTDSEGGSLHKSAQEKQEAPQERKIFTQDSFSIKQKPAVTEAQQSTEVHQKEQAEPGKEKTQDDEIHPERPQNVSVQKQVEATNKDQSEEIAKQESKGDKLSHHQEIQEGREDQQKSPEKISPVSVTVSPPKEAKDEDEKEVDYENKRAHKKLSDKGQTNSPTINQENPRQYYGQEQEYEYNEDYRDHQNPQYDQQQAYMENNRRSAAGAYFPGGQSRITNLHTVEEEEDVIGTRESYQPSPKAFEESRDSAQQQNTLGDDDYLNIHKEEIPKQKETKIEDEIEKLSKDSGSVIIADFEHSYEEDHGANGDKSKEQDAPDYNKKTLEELIGGEVSSIVYDVDPSHQDRVNTSVSNEKNIIPKSMEFFRKSGKSQNELIKDSDSKTDEDYQRDDSEHKSNFGRVRSNRGSGTFQPKSQDESHDAGEPETGELYKTPIKTSSVTRLAQPEEVLGGDDHDHEHEEQEEDIDVHVVDSEVNSQAGPGSVEDRFGIQNRDEIVGQIPESIRETFGKSGKKVVVAKIPQILTLSELTKKIIDEGRAENQNITPIRERRDDDAEERNILEERKEFESPFSYNYAENADHASSQGYPTPERSFIPKQESAANSQFDSPIKKLIEAANQKTEKLSNILSTVGKKFF